MNDIRTYKDGEVCITGKTRQKALKAVYADLKEKAKTYPYASHYEHSKYLRLLVIDDIVYVPVAYIWTKVYKYNIRTGELSVEW